MAYKTKKDILIRLEPEDHQAIKDVAAKLKQSVNSTIEALIFMGASALYKKIIRYNKKTIDKIK